MKLVLTESGEKLGVLQSGQVNPELTNRGRITESFTLFRLKFIILEIYL